MTDFLPKRSAQPSPAPNPPQPPAAGGRLSARPGPSESPNEKDDLSIEVKKAPSKFWTEYFGAAFLFVVAVYILVAYFVLQPLIIQYKKISGSIGAIGTQLTDQGAYLESLQRSIAAAQSIPPEALSHIDEALPRDPGIPKLLTMVAIIAQQQHIGLSSVSFASSPGGGLDGADVVDIDISVGTTGYLKTRELLEALEYNLRLFEVDTITIAGSAESSGSSEAGKGAQKGAQTSSQEIRIRTYNLSAPGSAAGS